jgi:hypothetical protein
LTPFFAAKYYIAGAIYDITVPDQNDSDWPAIHRRDQRLAQLSSGAAQRFDAQLRRAHGHARRRAAHIHRRRCEVKLALDALNGERR